MPNHISEHHVDRNVLHPSEKVWIGAWINAFAEPLVPLLMRNQYELEMLKLVHSKPHAMASIFTGAISMIMRSLPADDPWTQLRRISDSEVVMPDGTEFDSCCATDLTPPSGNDKRLDPMLAGLVVELDDASKVLLSVAPEGWDRTLGAAERIFSLVDLTMDEAEATLESLTAALRWATFRHQSYRGRESMFQVRALSLTLQYYDAPLHDNNKAIEALDSVDPDYNVKDGNWALIAGSEY
jgi:hypothetical protein